MVRAWWRMREDWPLRRKKAQRFLFCRKWGAGMGVGGFVLMGVGIWLIGCMPAGRGSAWPVVLDRERELRFRLEALGALREEELACAEARGMLSELIFGPGQPIRLRQAAWERLERTDPEYLRRELRRRLVEVQDAEFLQMLVEQMIRHGWQETVAGVVRSYAREDRSWPDGERPERRALAAWFPEQEPGEVVWRVFCGELGEPGVVEQAAAWELLLRLWDRGRLSRRLAAVAAEESVLVADVRAAVCELGIFPVNREDILRLMYLRQRQNGLWWERARERVAALNAEQRKGLELRHLPVLMEAEEELLKQSTDQLRERVWARLAGVHPIPGGADPRDIDCPGPQDLEAWQDRLCWADWLVLEVILDVLGDPGLVGSLLKQAERDYQDRSSEYGGLLVWSGKGAGKAEARLYEPWLRRHDRSFYPSLEMMEGLYTALAHYHFHAQSQDNRAYAGPGRADLKVAEYLRMHALVFTPIGRGRLNVDYYQPGGVVIDLGVIPRSGRGG